MNAAVPAGAPADRATRCEYVLRLADTSLILAQRLGEWIGHAPAIEEDMGLANTALDLLGQARFLLAYAGELEGKGRSEDELAFLRVEADYRNVTLVEQPNGDFADTIVRQVLIDAYQLELYERLVHSSDARIAEIAAKSVKETRYHLRYSSGWLIRLGDGTDESHRRAEAALSRHWKFTTELRSADALDRAMAADGTAPDLGEVATAWDARIGAILTEATLARPADQAYLWFGKQGRHSESLGHLLGDLQYLPRAFPGASW